MPLTPTQRLALAAVRLLEISFRVLRLSGHIQELIDGADPDEEFDGEEWFEEVTEDLQALTGLRLN